MLGYPSGAGCHEGEKMGSFLQSGSFVAPKTSILFLGSRWKSQTVGTLVGQMGTMIFNCWVLISSSRSFSIINSQIKSD
jgi:hypothetical protein